MHERIEKLCENLHDNEAALISSYPNIFYYSGFTSGDAYLLISHDARYIITDSRYTIQAREQAKDFKFIDIKDGFEKVFSKTCAKYIGFEENSMSVREYKKLRMRLAESQDFVEMNKLISKPRMIKDSGEIKRIAEAEKIGDEAFSYILGRIKTGMTEREIAFDLEFFMKKQGASALSFDTIAASGVRSAMPHGAASNKQIENGDFLTLDFGCVFEGYCSDMTRTVVIGRADPEMIKVYDTVLTAQKEALAFVEAGKTGAACDKVARDIIYGAGYEGCFGHSLGHGVGMYIHEEPRLSYTWEKPLEVGNIVTVEPGIYVADFGGVRIEDVVAITEDGCENLTHSPKELIELDND